MKPNCYVSLDSLCVRVAGNTVANSFVKLGQFSFSSIETCIYIIRVAQLTGSADVAWCVMSDNGQKTGTLAALPLRGTCAVGDAFSFPENHGLQIHSSEFAGIYVYDTAVAAVSALVTVYYRNVFGTKIKG